MTSPAISIVMPVKNAAQTLEETLESIEAQTFREFELIIIDDFSEDETLQLVKRWATRDGRFRWSPAESPGLVPSLNQALSEARAPLIARMDGDDLMLPTRLEKQRALFESDDTLGVVSCGVESFGENGIGEGFRLYDDWLNGLVSHQAMFDARFIESPLAHPSAMVRRSILLEIDGYREMGWPEDYDLWLRLFAKGVRFQKVPEVLLRWRDQPHRTSRVHHAYHPKAFQDCKISHLISGPLQSRRQIGIWGAGHWGGRLGRALMNEGYEVKFFVDIDPKKIGGTRHGMPIIASEGLTPDEETPLLISVGRRGARGLIEAFLHERDFVSGRDYFALA